MKTLVINLDHETERMSFQAQQLTLLGLDFQRMPAYKIKDRNDQLFQKYRNSWKRPMSISEVSCFFSHKNAWEQVIEQNQPMLILEDDAMLAQNVTCLLKALSKLKNIDYVNLEERMKRKKLLAKNISNKICESLMIQLYQGRSGAAGYILWPSGARKLLKQMQDKGIGIADKFINENYSMKAYQIEPAPIIQLDQCQLYGLKSPFTVRSSINSKTETKSTPWYFRIKRVIGEFKIALNYLRHFYHANRRSIKISDQFKKHP